MNIQISLYQDPDYALTFRYKLFYNKKMLIFISVTEYICKNIKSNESDYLAEKSSIEKYYHLSFLYSQEA